MSSVPKTWLKVTKTWVKVIETWVKVAETGVKVTEIWVKVTETWVNKPIQRPTDLDKRTSRSPKRRFRKIRKSKKFGSNRICPKEILRKDERDSFRPKNLELNLCSNIFRICLIDLFLGYWDFLEQTGTFLAFSCEWKMSFFLSGVIRVLFVFPNECLLSLSWLEPVLVAQDRQWSGTVALCWTTWVIIRWSERGEQQQLQAPPSYRKHAGCGEPRLSCLLGPLFTKPN